MDPSRRGSPHDPPDRSRASRRATLASGAGALAALCLLLVFGFWTWSRATRVVFETESDVGRVRVVERADGLRTLYTGDGRARQSAVFPGRPRHLEIAYTRVATLGLALVPADARILFVGLGGGAMPMHARSVRPEAHVEVVEIDPVIVDVANRFFGFRPDSNLVVHTADGRAFIERLPPGSFELIVLDAFSDDQIPFDLTTAQFLRAVREALGPGGVVVSNLWSSSELYGPMLATYGSVFGELHAIRVERLQQRILVAFRDPASIDRSALVAAARSLAREVDLGFDLPAIVEAGYERPRVPAAPLLMDDARVGSGSFVRDARLAAGERARIGRSSTGAMSTADYSTADGAGPVVLPSVTLRTLSAGFFQHP